MFNHHLSFLTPKKLLSSGRQRFQDGREAEISLTVVPVVVELGFTTLLTSQIIVVAFYSECGKSDKFCSEALISA